MANIFRIFWWHAEQFSNTIFFAAVIMVACQLVLLHTWVHALKAYLKKEKQGYDEKFWDWPHFDKYLSVIGTVTVSLVVCQFVFKGHNLYAWMLGTASAAIEAMLGVP